jgi:hypothetical protein
MNGARVKFIMRKPVVVVVVVVVVTKLSTFYESKPQPQLPLRLFFKEKSNTISVQHQVLCIQTFFFANFTFRKKKMASKL